MSEYYDNRLNAAQRRYLRACTTLARVRKMGAGRVTINNLAQTFRFGHPQNPPTMRHYPQRACDSKKYTSRARILGRSALFAKPHAHL
jgi:hypothetical protein